MVYKIIVVILLLPFVISTAAYAGEDIELLDANGKPLKPGQIDKVHIGNTCGPCHDVKKSAMSLHFNAGNDDPEANDCLSCHIPKEQPFNSDGTLRTAMVEPDMEQCASCHFDVFEKTEASVHGGLDKKKGDQPTCFTCHNHSPHKIMPVSKLSRKDKAVMCSNCHRDSAKMSRYGVSDQAVPSYEHSFHGKALLRFDKQNSAGCTDCHGYHDVLSPEDSAAPTNRRNAAATCGKCHQGAKMNFAMSGANHLGLKVEKSPLLRFEEMFFEVLTVGVMAGLMGMIALDLRRKVFCKGCRPQSGRKVGLLVALSFACVAAGIVMAYFGINGSTYAWISAGIFMVLALFVNAVLSRKRKAASQKVYPRFGVWFRMQHILLAVSFTVLVLTGMPLRFADVTWTHSIHALFGGFEGARIAHRTAAVLMIGTWIWHTIYLIYRWKQAGFSLRSWSMWPTRKDFTDFFHTVAYGLGLRNDAPKYDRFQFKEKFDYFAVYWGMPIMVFSGLVLWCSAAICSRLPELAYGVAYIAHSDEAILAMLAIMVWHIYNTHFNPDHFPMNPSWLTGTMTEEEMEREHPLEKERMDAAVMEKPEKRQLITEEK